MLTAALIISSLAAQQTASPAPPQPGVSVTIYSSADPRGFDPQQFAAQQRMGADPQFAFQVPGFGIVRETRPLQIKQGLNDLPFTDVAAFIDPTTVSFSDLTDPKTSVLEQNFQFDLVSPAKLYERYLGEAITVHLNGPKEVQSITGTLLSANQGQLVLDAGAMGVTVLPMADARVQLGALPGGLLTKPTLLWKVNAASGGEHMVRTTYQTAGMTWRADYNVVLNADDSKASLTPWVTLLNVSGAGFRDAQLKLIAGDVQVIRPQQPITRSMRAPGAPAAPMADAAGFEEQSLFEYHLYTLPRRTDVLANTSQQLALFPPVAEVPIQKELIYIGAPNLFGYGGGRLDDPELGGSMNRKVAVYVTFRNDEASSLGMPLPKGRIRVFKQDPKDGSLEFVGEDLIDHTPRNETVRLKLGDAFDVTGERITTDFKIDKNRKTMTESFRITVKNAKDIPQNVQIREYLYRWSTWEITAKTADFRKIDARTISFDVEVPAEGSKTVEYTVRYTW